MCIRDRLSYWQRMNSNDSLTANTEEDTTQNYGSHDDGTLLEVSKKKNGKKAPASSPKRPTSSTSGRKLTRDEISLTTETNTSASQHAARTAATAKERKPTDEMSWRQTAEPRTKAKNRAAATRSRSSSNSKKDQSSATRSSRSGATRALSARKAAPRPQYRLTQEVERTVTIESSMNKKAQPPKALPSTPLKAQDFNQSSTVTEKKKAKKVRSRKSATTAAVSSNATAQKAALPKGVLHNGTSQQTRKSPSNNKVRFDPSVVATTSTLIEEPEDLEYSYEKAVEIVRMDL